MRTIDELKQIFKTEQEFMINNHMELIAATANTIADGDETAGEIAHNNLKAICKERMDQYDLTDDEMEIIKANQQAWTIELAEAMIHKLRENVDGKENP